jgi:probable rRNA maturation factor
LSTAERPALGLSVQFADPRHKTLLGRHRLKRWLTASLDRPAELTVRFVDAAEGRALNAGYRQRDYATNVLTFDYEQAPVAIADLVLCTEVIEQEAADLGVALVDHYAHLLVHGALHAQGWDHEADDEAQAMEARETAILAALGIADPYAGRTAGD